jgi:hypothetical protein
MSEARANGTASRTARPIAREDRTDADQTRRKPRMTMVTCSSFSGGVKRIGRLRIEPLKRATKGSDSNAC